MRHLFIDGSGDTLGESISLPHQGSASYDSTSDQNHNETTVVWDAAMSSEKQGLADSSVATSSVHEETTRGDSSLDLHDMAVQQKIGVIPLAVIIFYGVSGGPFGVEETVRSAGTFYSLLGFLVMPFIWSVQEALMTAELGSAFPEAAGGVVWVEEAFGSCAGWMTGYLNWVSGASDNALYPILFLDYLLETYNGGADSSMNHTTKFVLFTVISCVLAYTNWLGLSVVGNTSMTICFIAISPFIILSIVGAFQVDPSRWFLPPMDLDAESDTDDTNNNDSASVGLFSIAALSNIHWRPYLNNLFWNLNSFDNTAAFAGETEDPGRVLPRALGWSVFMVGACYLIPLLIAFGASSAKQNEWVDGYFAVVAGEIAGPWLAAWLVFAAGISNIAMFQSELSSDAFQLLGMAERGYIPKIFATRSQHGTPTYGILLGTLVIVCLTVTNLDQLIEMLNFNYAFSLLLEYLAFLKLRVTRPDLERPFRIPLNTVGCIILLTPTFFATLAVVALASRETFLMSICANALGLFLFWMHGRQVSPASEEYTAVDQTASTVAFVSEGQERPTENEGQLA